MFAGQQIQQQAHLHVVSKSLYSQDSARTAVPYGVLDHRMVSVWACAVGERREEPCLHEDAINECLLQCWQIIFCNVM